MCKVSSTIVQLAIISCLQLTVIKLNTHLHIIQLNSKNGLPGKSGSGLASCHLDNLSKGFWSEVLRTGCPS